MENMKSLEEKIKKSAQFHNVLFCHYYLNLLAVYLLNWVCQIEENIGNT